MKKLLKISGSIMAVIFAMIASVPFFVDADKYRPQLMQAVNEHIHGKLELGKLKLSLWGRIRVEAAGLNLVDRNGQKILSAKEAFFDLPFLPLLTGSPTLTFKVDQPEIRITKNKKGEMNVMTLMKGDMLSAEEAQKVGQTASGGGKGGESVAVPAIVSRARLGVEIKNANLFYRDDSLEQPVDSQTKNLNLTIQNLSLNDEMKLNLWAELDTKLGKKGTLGTIKGPIKFQMKAKPQFGKTTKDELEKLDAETELNLTDVEINLPGTFQKNKGVEAYAQVSVHASDKDAQLKNLLIKFHNAELKGNGAVTREGEKYKNISVQLKSNTIDFKSWSELLPSLKDFELSGTGHIEAEANGPLDQFRYRANIKLSKLSAKAPMLKAQPVVDADLNIVTDQVENLLVTFKAPGSEATLRGKVISFSKPKVDFTLTSSGLDLNQLIHFPETPEAKPGTPGAGAPSASAEAGKSASDLDASLDPMRESPAMVAMTMNGSVAIKFIQMKKIKLTDIESKLSARDLSFGMDQFGFKLWGGKVSSQALVNIKPKTPTYRFNAKVSQLDLNHAVAANIQMIKNTILGIADFEVAGTGASLNADKALSQLNAKGQFKIKEATFTTIDVAKMTSEAINGAIAKLAQSIPQAQGKKIGGLPQVDTKYEFISSDFTIAGGKFSAPNFTTKAYANRGIDLKGNTAVGLKDYSLNTRWEVIDTYNLTKAKDLSIDTNGISVQHILSEGGAPVKFPVSAGCTVFSPCYNYGETPEYLAKIALNNVAKATTQRIKNEAGKRIEQELKKAAPAPVQNAIDNLKKGFGF